MRKIIIFIIFLISIFIINLIFYFISDDYKFFIKKLKNNDTVIYLDDKNYDDKKVIDEKNVNEKILKNAEVIDTDKTNTKIFKIWQNHNWSISLKEDVVLWKNYKLILDLFSIYNLKKLDINSNLFDLTDEYPDNYFEYYSKDLTLYLFPTKNYTELYDIFSVLTNELPITINEVNNFWDNSFYINLDNDIQDRFIRVVISYRGVVFWLKIKKNEYNLVKEKLNWLK